MALVQLSDEQAQRLSVRDKDQWWLDNVYQGDAAQMTLRVVVCGFLLGGQLSITNLYVGAKIGVSLGTAITAVVLAFVTFRALSQFGIGRNYHVAEGAMLQSIACSAGYMSSPLTASMAAFMMVTNAVVPGWQMVLWLLGLAALGVVFAIPLKRRFINAGQFPFPEGRACGVVLDKLHESDSTDRSLNQGRSASGLLSARLLVRSGAAAGILRFLQSEPALQKLRLAFIAIPEALDDWYYRLAARHGWWVPSISGIPIRELTIRPTIDIAVMALGGLMGIRTCLSLVIGAMVNYCILVPWMIGRGDIPVGMGTHGWPTVGFRAITTWSL